MENKDIKSLNISLDEAEEALAVIESIKQKTRHSIAQSGAYIFLIVQGFIWLFGFLATQFLPGEIIGFIWSGLAVLGAIISVILGNQLGKRLRSSSAASTGKRVITLWIFMILFCITAIVSAWPIDGKQITIFIILFMMAAWVGMGLLLSYKLIWWSLPFTGLTLIGYFFLPDIFFLWIATLVGGGMVTLGFYIRLRW